MNRSTPGLPVHHQLLEFTQTYVHRVSDAIQPSHLLSSSPPAPNPSQHQSLFQWVNSLHEVAKVLSFSFSIIPSKEHPGLISFRMDWLDVLAVQGTLKSLLQHHSSEHQFFGAQISSQSNSHIHTWPLEKPYCSFILFLSLRLHFISSSCLIIIMVRTPCTVLNRNGQMNILVVLLILGDELSVSPVSMGLAMGFL